MADTKKKTPLFSSKDPELLLNTILGIIPGGQHAGKIIKKEYEETFKRKPGTPKKKDTYLKDLVQLPIEAGKDVVSSIKGIPRFLASILATPAISASEGLNLGPKGTIDLGPLGKQSSFQEQRKQLKNSGAGEVYSDVVPLMQWLLSVAAVKNAPKVIKQIAKTGEWVAKGMPQEAPRAMRITLEDVYGRNALDKSGSGKSQQDIIRESVSVSIVPNKAKGKMTIGELQKMSQRERGLGMLADLDDAMNSGNISKAQKIKNSILAEPSTSKYAPYKVTVQGYVDLMKPKNYTPLNIKPKIKSSSILRENDAISYQEALDSGNMGRVLELSSRYPKDSQFQVHNKFGYADKARRYLDDR